ncbi:MAG: peptidoglycan-associated lipoprotein Pal [Pseudomonadota bacterium]
MFKRLSVYLLVFGLTFSLSIFLNSCSKKAVKGIDTSKEVAQVLDEEPTCPEPVKDTGPKKEAQMRDDGLQKQRERDEAVSKDEAARKAEAAEREAQLREEFEQIDIHFAYDKSDLTNEATGILGNKVAYLQGHPNIKTQIEGHCDERGSNEYNMALGERRANSAMQYLVTSGIEASRISTISYGEEKPIAVGQNEEAWAKNRRSHFVIVSE